MKTKFWIVLLVLLLAVSAAASLLLLKPGKIAAGAEIYSGGKLVRTVSLAMDQEFTVPSPDGGFNTVTVKDGKIAVTSASCPDQYCARRGFCNSGSPIVCLPNGLVIQFITENPEVDFAVG